MRYLIAVDEQGHPVATVRPPAGYRLDEVAVSLAEVFPRTDKVIVVEEDPAETYGKKVLDAGKLKRARDAQPLRPSELSALEAIVDRARRA